ncbi:hypothetical protein K504DRAFT_487504 [Pleomassaria siparia CBS 279.74]|uniref:2'-phosphotransferase n=1 Tax=Pleomassaria siparia CBS 279.74 TaxID=1314801 RepID=A0A6G1KJF3_9PLEO|nr:hypothetical protein K504DRAFT_487504 [Pleomassaria siparia CBS 279.74]
MSSNRRGGTGGGRGGGRGSRNPKDLPRDQQVSRKISWLLRHGAGKEGLTLGEGGYVNVRDALNTNALKGLSITFPELRSVVSTNDKQRFSMILASSLKATDTASAPVEKPEEGKEGEGKGTEALSAIPESDDPADYLIRANQGHSIKIDVEGLLTPITEEAGNVPETVVHGTYEAAWNMILKSGGLRKMGRNHIHFASGLPAGYKALTAYDDEEQVGMQVKRAPPVISGMRNSSTILIYVDIRAAMQAGVKFYLSDNGVVLTEGNDEGFLPYNFFKRVESRKTGGGVLMVDGVLPEGTQVNVDEWEREMAYAKRGPKDRREKGGVRGSKTSFAYYYYTQQCFVSLSAEGPMNGIDVHVPFKWIEKEKKKKKKKKNRKPPRRTATFAGCRPP